MSHIRSRSKDREALLGDEKIDTSILGNGKLSFTETRRQKMLQHGCAVPNVVSSAPSSSLVSVSPTGAIELRNPVCTPHTVRQKVNEVDATESKKNQRLLITMAIFVGTFAIAEFVFGVVTGSLFGFSRRLLFALLRRNKFQFPNGVVD
jgi:hypothetical protein